MTNKRIEYAKGLIITTFVVSLIVAPPVLASLISIEFSYGYTFAFVWFAILVYIGVWLEEGEASETSTDLDLTDEGPETPPKLSITEYAKEEKRKLDR